MATLILERFLRFPSSNLCALLLTLGADANARNLYGRSALDTLTRSILSLEQSFRRRSRPLRADRTSLIALLEPNSRRALYTSYVETLLERGAHLDMADKRRNTILDRLPRVPVHVPPLAHTNLQCLCARTIRQQRIPFADLLPRHLALFVQMH